MGATVNLLIKLFIEGHIYETHYSTQAPYNFHSYSVEWVSIFS